MNDLRVRLLLRRPPEEKSVAAEQKVQQNCFKFFARRNLRSALFDVAGRTTLAHRGIRSQIGSADCICPSFCRRWEGLTEI